MSNFVIKDDDGNAKSFILMSYAIGKSKKEEWVIVTLESDGFSISYKLLPDVRFNSKEIINDKLEEEISNVVEKNIDLIITEYFLRNYIFIGHETDTEYRRLQFTAEKLGVTGAIFKRRVSPLYKKQKMRWPLNRKGWGASF